MTDYLRALTFAAALVSLALLFFPERRGLRRTAQTAFSLLFLLLLLPRDGSFLPKELLSLSDPPKIEAGTDYQNALSSSVSEGIRRDLASRFSLSEADLSIETDLILTEEALTGSYLYLFLGGKNFFADATAILRYVESTYGVRCEVCYVGA